MARILIIGGHGKIARLLAPQLVEHGDAVVSAIRKPEQVADIEETGAKALVADFETLDVEQVAALLADQDAIVWSAGAGGGDPERTYAVDRDAAIRTMAAAEQAGVRRFVMVSYFDAGPDHGVDPENSFFAYAEAKAAADAHLRDSGLDWTILGPSSLTLESATGTIDAQAETSRSVSRENVARVIRAVLDDDSTIGRTIRFNDGETPISDAIRV
ncbi:SDR family oxidoreductase [Leucobacter sp. GX24907]